MSAPWPYPSNAHVPGRTPRPLESPAFDAAAAAPVYTVDRMWSQNTTYLYGIDLYNSGYFWEAHEVWEPVWMRSAGNSRERIVVQGLIQLSNACLKLLMERPEAAARLLVIAREKIIDAARPAPVMMGLELDPLSVQIAGYSALLARHVSGDTDELLAHRPVLKTMSVADATPA